MDVIFSFHFGLFFALLTRLQSEKSKLKKKNENKTPGDIIILPMRTKIYDRMMHPKIMITWCTVPEI